MALFDLTASEVWYPFPGFPPYQISSHYRVRNPSPQSRILKRNGTTLLTWTLIKAGYLYVRLTHGGRVHSIYQHHIVAQMAHGPRPGRLHVLHRDDVKTNNDPNNLYYGTPAENACDRGRNGREPRGENRPNARFTADEIREIRRLAGEGTKQREIARRFKTGQQYVSAIVRRVTWAHIS